MVSVLTPPPEYLQLAKEHIAYAEAEVRRQVTRITRLHAVGADTADAEKLLSTFQRTLDAMRHHLDVESRA